MRFVWWLTGVLATIAACKFLILVFKKIMTKENIDDMLNRANSGLQEAANNVARWYAKNKKKRKKQKVEKEIERNLPIVEIH